MFEPTVSPGNPGQGPTLSIAFDNGEEEWEEHIDLTHLLQEALAAAGHAAERQGAWLKVGQGFWLLPQFAGWDHDGDEGKVTTSTTIEVVHEQLAPEGLFEYQHYTSSDGAEPAFRGGFGYWCQTDAVALFDSAQADASECMSMTIDYPAANGVAAMRRRVVFGPVARRASQPTATAADSGHAGECADDGSCPCCLFTNTMDSFDAVLKSGEFAAIRLYAARGPDGQASSDCRVNGEDHGAGAAALVGYAGTWPVRGLEFRKQLVIVHTLQP